MQELSTFLFNNNSIPARCVSAVLQKQFFFLTETQDRPTRSLLETMYCQTVRECRVGPPRSRNRGICRCRKGIFANGHMVFRLGLAPPSPLDLFFFCFPWSFWSPLCRTSSQCVSPFLFFFFLFT